MAEQSLPEVYIYTRINSLSMGFRRNLLEPFGILPVALNVVIPRCPCEFQRNTLVYTFPDVF